MEKYATKLSVAGCLFLKMQMTFTHAINTRQAITMYKWIS